MVSLQSVVVLVLVLVGFVVLTRIADFSIASDGSPWGERESQRETDRQRKRREIERERATAFNGSFKLPF